MIKPKILLSKCLELECCRYNGQFISDKFIRKLLPFVEVIPVCPEVEIGLGIPRPEISIYEKKETKELLLLQPKTNEDHTKVMTSFSKTYLSSLEVLDGAILKAKSPSCALKDAKIRDLKTSMPHATGPGFFGKEVLHKFNYLAIEDEKRLSNAKIREHFLLQLFTLARLRKALEKNTYSSLEEFHRTHKYLLQLFSQKTSRN